MGITMFISVNHQKITIDKEGYLKNLSDWNEAVANTIAQHDHLVLTNDHWQVINFLRNFYNTYQTTPAMRVMLKELARIIEPEKVNSIYLQQLFPQGIFKQGSKIAGLPKPTRCT